MAQSFLSAFLQSQFDSNHGKTWPDSSLLFPLFFPDTHSDSTMKIFEIMVSLENLKSLQVLD